MEEVREILGIDKVDMSGNLIFVEEHHNADANFVLQAVTSHGRANEGIICYVLFHNTFGHIHNVGMKLGYNLRKDYGSMVKVVEPLKTLSRNIYRKASSQSDHELNLKNDNETLVRQLVQMVQNECISIDARAVPKKKYLIIDDLCHLFDIGLSVQDVWRFTRYLRSFVQAEPSLVICISCHIYKAMPELCPPNLLAVALRHSAQLVISVQPLESGHTRNVSGKMIINWKLGEERLKFKWPEEIVYLYKLFDRQVKLFAPGASYVM